MSTPLINQLAEIRSKQPWLVLSAADKFSLASSNNQVISHFYRFQPKESNEQTFAIPDGCVDILFDCDPTKPNAHVFGTPMKPINIELNKDHYYFGVRFLSGVMPDFLAVSATELVGNNYQISDIILHDNHILEEMTTRLNFSEQIALFNRFIDNKKIREFSRVTSTVLHHICKTNGTIRINELERESGYSIRTIQRKFNVDMGMSPKAFSRIIRCQSAVYDINQSEKVDFSNMAFELGFSDQSHFLREFKKLVNATPLDYLTRVKHQTYLEKIQYL